MDKRWLLVICLLCLALLPYTITCFYALPFADDFCFGWTSSEKIPFIQKILNQYLLWNGRYSADILVNIHPITSGKLWIYQIVLLCSLLLTPLVLFGLFNQLLKNTTISVIAALSCTLFYLCYQPDITEGIYWYIGISNYHLGNMCFLLQLLLLIKSFPCNNTGKKILFTCSLLLLVIATGFNEIASVVIPIGYLTSFILFYEHKYRKYFFICFLVAIIASAFVLLSPGNFTRETIFHDRFNFSHSAIYSVLQTFRFIGLWASNIAFIGFSIIILALADKIHINWIRKTDHRVIVAFMLFVVFMGSFMPYYATGSLGQHRTINYVFIYFILLWVWFLIAASIQLSLHIKLAYITQNNRTWIIAGTCCLSFIVTGNGLKQIQDFSSGMFTAYYNEFKSRQSATILHPEKPIERLMHIPRTFKIVDARSSDSYWVDKCMKRFYTETKIELK